jgi:hypothetical protein
VILKTAKALGLDDDPMAKEPKKLDELFHETLKDIFFAEKKILVFRGKEDFGDAA